MINRWEWWQINENDDKSMIIVENCSSPSRTPWRAGGTSQLQIVGRILKAGWFSDHCSVDYHIWMQLVILIFGWEEDNIGCFYCGQKWRWWWWSGKYEETEHLNFSDWLTTGSNKTGEGCHYLKFDTLSHYCHYWLCWSKCNTMQSGSDMLCLTTYCSSVALTDCAGQGWGREGGLSFLG